MVYLMYHDVYKDNPCESGFQNDSAFQYKVSLSQFEQHLQAILNYSKRVNKDLKDIVQFTFDDGGVSFYTVVAPTLEKYGLTGIFFVSTKYIGTEGFMSCEMIEELARRGHIIGSHSHTHPRNMTQMPRDEIVGEWQESTSILSAIIGQKIEVASLPNGVVDKTVLTIARDNGLNVVYTSEPTNSRKNNDMVLRGRYVVYDTTEYIYIIRLVSSGLFRLMIEVRYKMLSFVKCVCGHHYDEVKSLIVKLLNSKR